MDRYRTLPVATVALGETHSCRWLRLWGGRPWPPCLALRCPVRRYGVEVRVRTVQWSAVQRRVAVFQGAGWYSRADDSEQSTEDGVRSEYGVWSMEYGAHTVHGATAVDGG